MNDLGSYVSSIIGRPWGPEKDDNCWALVAEVQSRFFGRDLPGYAAPRMPRARHAKIHDHPMRAYWVRTANPVHGAVVLMSRDVTPRLDEHAGVCLMLPAPLILHVENPQGVCVDDLMQITMRGWKPEFYVPA